VLLADARGIDVASRRVLLDPGGSASAGGGGDRDDLPYDYLIVAAGAAHAYFGHPEWAARAPGLKTLDDALEIRRQILLAFEAAERETDPQAQRRLLTFVIVGGGPTGVELAGALAEIARRTLRQDFRSIRPESARIVLLEGGSYVLPTFPEPLRDAARVSLTRLGVEVRTSSMVTGVDREGVTWRAAADPSATQERLPAQTVLWAAGASGGLAWRPPRPGGPRHARINARRTRASGDPGRRRHLRDAAGRPPAARRSPGGHAGRRARGGQRAARRPQ
jgi:NADH dehydrogenase